MQIMFVESLKRTFSHKCAKQTSLSSLSVLRRARHARRIKASPRTMLMEREIANLTSFEMKQSSEKNIDQEF